METQTTVPMHTCKYCNCAVPLIVSNEQTESNATSDTTECATSRSTTPDSPESTGKQSSNRIRTNTPESPESPDLTDMSRSSTPEVLQVVNEEQPFISQIPVVKKKLKRTDAQLAALERGRQRLAEKRRLLKEKQKQQQLEVIHETDENEESNVNNSSCSIL